jgi:hypothetical protein
MNETRFRDEIGGEMSIRGEDLRWGWFVGSPAVARAVGAGFERPTPRAPGCFNVPLERETPSFPASVPSRPETMAPSIEFCLLTDASLPCMRA